MLGWRRIIRRTSTRGCRDNHFPIVNKKRKLMQMFNAFSIMQRSFSLLWFLMLAVPVFAQQGQLKLYGKGAQFDVHSDAVRLYDQPARGEHSIGVEKSQFQYEMADLHAFKDGHRIDRFSIHMYESPRSWGGGVVLENADEQQEAGFFLDNPEWSLEDAKGRAQIYDGNGTQRWIRVRFEFDWPNRSYTYHVRDLDSGHVETGTRPLKQGQNVATVALRNNSGAGNTGDMNMWFDDIRLSAETFNYHYGFENGEMPTGPGWQAPPASAGTGSPIELLVKAQNPEGHRLTQGSYENIVTVASGTTEPERINLPSGQAVASFTWRQNQPGAHRIRASHPRLREATHTIEFSGGQQLALQAEQTEGQVWSRIICYVTVQDEHGNPVAAGQYNDLISVSGGEVNKTVTVTDGVTRARFIFSPSGPGEYTITANHPDLESAEQTIKINN